MCLLTTLWFQDVVAENHAVCAAGLLKQLHRLQSVEVVFNWLRVEERQVAGGLWHALHGSPM